MESLRSYKAKRVAFPMKTTAKSRVLDWISVAYDAIFNRIVNKKVRDGRLSVL